MKKWSLNCFGKGRAFAYGLVGLSVVVSNIALAQDGKVGIDKANDMVRGYYDAGVNLMFAAGAIVGIIGAIKVYNKWTSGDPDTARAAASWFGACIFLVVVASALKSFFGIP